MYILGGLHLMLEEWLINFLIQGIMTLMKDRKKNMTDCGTNMLKHKRKMVTIQMKNTDNWLKEHW